MKVCPGGASFKNEIQYHWYMWLTQHTITTIEYHLPQILRKLSSIHLNKKSNSFLRLGKRRFSLMKYLKNDTIVCIKIFRKIFGKNPWISRTEPKNNKGNFYVIAKRSFTAKNQRASLLQENQKSRRVLKIMKKDLLVVTFRSRKKLFQHSIRCHLHTEKYSPHRENQVNASTNSHMNWKEVTIKFWQKLVNYKKKCLRKRKLIIQSAKFFRSTGV